MVTGLKIARRARRGQEISRSGGAEAQQGVTPTPGLPISLGPDVGGNAERSEKMSSSGGDFVWAFSLRRVYYRRGMKVGRSKAFTDGATLEDRTGKGEEEEDEDEDEDEEEEVDPSELEVIVDGLANEDFTGKSSTLVQVVETHRVGNEEFVLFDEKMKEGID
jgi:hypothetical protein